MAKRQQIREERRRKEQRTRLLWVGAGVLVLLVLLAIILPNVLPGANRVSAADIQQAEQRPHPQADMNRLGDPNAPVIVVEYADYLCSHCQDYALNTEGLFIQTFVETGQVYYEYLPVNLQNPGRTESIEATYCAGDQDAFWPYKDLVYTNIVRTPNALGSNYLTAYAESLNLDLDAFNNCIRSGKYADMNAANLQLGRDDGIPGTPTFVVNGTLASRVELFQAVENELTRLGR
jgi:protein-disulfide isomerase